jgi:hypothetical protein
MKRREKEAATFSNTFQFALVDLVHIKGDGSFAAFQDDVIGENVGAAT